MSVERSWSWKAHRVVEGGESTTSSTTREIQVEISFEPLRLRTNRPWKTAHSTSDVRTNASFRIRVDGSHVGTSEVGLPPVKPGIYDGTVADCEGLVVDFAEAASSNDVTGVEGCPLEHEPRSEDERTYLALFRSLLGALDDRSERYPRSARALVETAIYRCLSAAVGVTVSNLLGIGDRGQKDPRGWVQCFYTIGMASSRADLEDDLGYGSATTSFLKFKADTDVEYVLEVFSLLEEKGLLVSGRRTVAIDANCSWTPDLASAFLRRLERYLPHIFMIEQPFPFDMPWARAHSDHREGWERFKTDCGRHGVMVFADESMRTSQDVAHLQRYCRGVNLKLEKAGGYREAVRAWEACWECGEGEGAAMKVWLGCMVGSALNCNVIVEILPMCDGFADLDGFLLVEKDCQPCEPSFTLTRGPHGLLGCIDLNTIAEPARL